MKLLLSLLSALASLLTIWKRRELTEQGRKEQILDAMVEVENRVKKAEAAAAAVDPVRDERLRNRFDRSHGGE